MAGKGIPRRYSNHDLISSSLSKTDLAAVKFRARQDVLTRFAYLDTDMIVKALDEGLKSSGSKKGTREAGENSDNYVPELKLDWNPRARRKPGQVLKLHTNFREMTSDEGAKWGWVDPVRKLTDEEKAAGWTAFIDEYKKRPKPIVYFYANGPDGQPTKQIVKAMEVTPYGMTDRPDLVEKGNLESKSDDFSIITRNVLNGIIATTQLFPVNEKKLGKTISELLPSQRLSLQRAVARGLVIDANGKMRCPPGTPNANQFTDIDMSNCMAIDPAQAVGRVRSWMNNINARADQIRSEERIREITGSAQSRFDEARKNINTHEKSKKRQDEVDMLNEEFLRDLRDANGLSIDERIAAEGFDLNNPDDQEIIKRTNLRHLMGLEILREKGEGPEWRGLVEDMMIVEVDKQTGNWSYKPFTWDGNMSFKDNIAAYHQAIGDSTDALMADQLLGTHDFGNGRQTNVYVSDIKDKRIRDEILAKRPDLFQRYEGLRNFMIRANTDVRQGNLEALIDSRNDNPDAFAGITELRAYTPDPREKKNIAYDFMHTQGMVAPLPDDPTGTAKIDWFSNSWSRVLKPLLESEAITTIAQELTQKHPYGISVSLDFEAVESMFMNEMQKLTAMEELLTESMDADTYARSIKASPENAIEAEVQRLMTELREADPRRISEILSQYGLRGFKMPSGADLTILKENIAKRLGVGTEVIDAAWTKFSRGAMYGADMSAARHYALNGDLFAAIFKARARHDAYHEFGHVLQYKAAENFIKRFAAENGGYPIFENGRVTRVLPGDTSKWTSKEWMDALSKGVISNPQFLSGFPPTGVGELEDNMLHLISGNYYQDKVGAWQMGSNLSPELQVALTEAHVELNALRKTGVISGPEIDRQLEYMDKVIPSGAGTSRYFGPRPTPEETPDVTPDEPPALPPGTPGTPDGGTPDGKTPDGKTPGDGGGSGKKVTVTVGDTVVNNSGTTNINVNGDGNIIVNTGDIIVGPIIINGEEIDGDTPINVTVNIYLETPKASKPKKKKSTKKTPTKKTKPTPDGEAPETPETPKTPETRQDKASRDLWRRINGYIAEDGATEWKVAPTAKGLRPGNDRSQQKTFIDEVFGLTADDTSVGGAGDSVADPFGSTQAYKSMTPDQLDARFEKIKTQVDDLIEQSRSRQLTKDEQAKIWLGMKAMRQVIRENQERAQYTDERRAAVAASKRQPDQRPGKYLSKQEGTSSVLSSKTATSMRRRSLEKARTQREGDVVEVDEDELIHYQRTIAKHAGRSTTGKDGWSVSGNEYQPGRAIEAESHVVTDTPADKTVDGKARKVRPNAATDPSSYGKRTREATDAKLKEDESKAISGAVAINERQSARAMDGPEAMSDAVKASAKARRDAEISGETLAEASPDVESPLLDSEITRSIAPTLRALDKSMLDQDVEATFGVPESEVFDGLGQGEIIDSTEMIRGRMISHADSEVMGSSELTATRRIRVIAPSGSRGLTEKNYTDGETSDLILPPGEFVITDIDEDGTITIIPHRQETSVDTLSRMVDDLDEATQTLTGGDADEARRIRETLNAEIAKSNQEISEFNGPIGSKSTTRGVSGEIGAAKRGRSRNVELSKSYSESSSRPFDVDNDFVENINQASIEDPESVSTLFPPASRSQVKRLNTDSMLESVMEIKQLIDARDTDMREPLPDYMTQQIQDLIASSTPEEITDMVSNALLNLHNSFDERIRVDMDDSGLRDLMENGRIRTPSEIKPNSSASQVREAFETSVGFSPDIDPSERTISGRLVHRSEQAILDAEIAERTRNGFIGTNQYASRVVGGREKIEIVALPEVSQRSSYSRGAAIKNRDSMSPILSQDRDDITLAMFDFTTSTREQRNEFITRAIASTQRNVVSDLLKPSSKSESRDNFETLIPGGIDFTEIEQIRVPAKLVNADESYSFKSVLDSNQNVKSALNENGFSVDEQSAIVEMVDDGRLSDIVPSAEIIRQRRGAAQLRRDFENKHGKSTSLVFTREDGINIMDENGFSNFPGAPSASSADDALAYRAAVEIAQNVSKIKEALASPGSRKKRATPRASVNESLIMGSKSTTRGPGGDSASKARRRAGTVSRVIGSNRVQKLLERAGLSEENAEATQFVGELAAAFAAGGPAGLATVFARRAGRDIADLGLREALDRGWLSPDQARRVEQQLLDRVAPEGLPERLTEAIEKGAKLATSDETRERAREVATAAREFIEDNERIQGVAQRAREVGGSVRERLQRRRAGRDSTTRDTDLVESASSDDPFATMPDDPFTMPVSDPFTGAANDPFEMPFDPFATDSAVVGSKSTTRIGSVSSKPVAYTKTPVFGRPNDNPTLPGFGYPDESFGTRQLHRPVYEINGKKIMFGPRTWGRTELNFDDDVEVIPVDPYAITGLDPLSPEGKEMALLFFSAVIGHNEWLSDKEGRASEGNSGLVPALLYAASRGDDEARRELERLAQRGDELMAETQAKFRQETVRNIGGEPSSIDWTQKPDVMVRVGKDENGLPIRRPMGIDDIFIVHQTSYEPEIDEDGNTVLRPTGDFEQNHLEQDKPSEDQSGINPHYDRSTIHFATNAVVSGHGARPTPSGKTYAIIVPLRDVLDANPGALENLLVVDTWFSPPIGEGLKIPLKSGQVVEIPGFAEYIDELDQEFIDRGYTIEAGTLFRDGQAIFNDDTTEYKQRRADASRAHDAEVRRISGQALAEVGRSHNNSEEYEVKMTPGGEYGAFSRDHDIRMDALAIEDIPAEYPEYEGGVDSGLHHMTGSNNGEMTTIFMDVPGRAITRITETEYARYWAMSDGARQRFFRQGQYETGTDDDPTPPITNAEDDFDSSPDAEFVRGSLSRTSPLSVFAESIGDPVEEMRKLQTIVPEEYVSRMEQMKSVLRNMSPAERAKYGATLATLLTGIYSKTNLPGSRQLDNYGDVVKKMFDPENIASAFEIIEALSGKSSNKAGEIPLLGGMKKSDLIKIGKLLGIDNSSANIDKIMGKLLAIFKFGKKAASDSIDTAEVERLFTALFENMIGIPNVGIDTGKETK